jgi:hypothetical protein
LELDTLPVPDEKRGFEQLRPKPAFASEASRETQLSRTLADSSWSGGHAIPPVLLGCRQIYADSLEVVQMGANQLAAYDFSAILGR